MTTATQAEFARLMGVNRSTVTRTWKQAGRLVMNGDRVDVEASRARIKATADPNRRDVAERHAEYRGAEVGAGDTAAIETAAPRSPAPSAPSAPDAVGNSYQAARAVKEKYSALKAKADYETQIGNLIPREEVEAAFLAVGGAVRAALDVMPDQVAPVIAPVTDLEDAHAVLSEAGRTILHGIHEAIKRAKIELQKGTT